MRMVERTLMKRLQLFTIFGLLAICLPAVGVPRLQAAAIRNLTGFQANVLAANDDGSTPLTPLGFTVNFFGTNFSSAYVNNNGNMTFDSALSTFTPFGLENAGRQIIAPFFADVDTRGAGSGLVTYGNDTVDGRPAFGVNWINVGYYGSHTNKLNSFQLVLIDRSDLGPGDFDMEFNYDQIQWETGDASSGSNGLGGNSARAGYSNGSQLPGTSFELPGSAVNGGFLDSNLTTGLINQKLSNPQDGRDLFLVRNGFVQQENIVCIQDDRTNDHIQFNLDTGEYAVTRCSDESMLTGTGLVRQMGCITVLRDVHSGRNLFAISQNSPCGTRGQFRVIDRDTRIRVNGFDSDTTDNTCSCGGDQIQVPD